MDNSAALGWPVRQRDFPVPFRVPARDNKDQHRCDAASVGRRVRRYLWLLEEMKGVRYDDGLLPKGDELRGRGRLRLGDLFGGVSCWPRSARDHKRPHADVRELYGWADRFRAGVVETTDQRNRRRKAGLTCAPNPGSPPETVAAVRTAAVRWTAARFGAGVVAITEGPRFSGHPDLRYPLIPSTSPVSRDFRRREYWRGPVWPVLTWLFRGRSHGAAGPNVPRCCAVRAYGRPKTGRSPSTTNRSPASRWAACSSRGPRPRCWTGWADRYFERTSPLPTPKRTNGRRRAGRRRPNVGFGGVDLLAGQPGQRSPAPPRHGDVLGTEPAQRVGQRGPACGEDSACCA